MLYNKYLVRARRVEVSDERNPRGKLYYNVIIRMKCETCGIYSHSVFDEYKMPTVITPFLFWSRMIVPQRIKAKQQ